MYYQSVRKISLKYYKSVPVRCKVAHAGSDHFLKYNTIFSKNNAFSNVLF
jgi:hypothetical protein